MAVLVEDVCVREVGEESGLRTQEDTLGEKVGELDWSSVES